jgi:hypothetical protein
MFLFSRQMHATSIYRIEELLELLEERGQGPDPTAPLVVTSQDRMDIVLGLLASQVRHRMSMLIHMH